MPGRKREDGRCESSEGMAGRRPGARAGNGPPAPAVTGKEVRVHHTRIQVEPRTCYLFALSLWLRAIFTRRTPLREGRNPWNLKCIPLMTATPSPILCAFPAGRPIERPCWQTGWVGGINAAWPLYAEGSDVTRARALSTMDFMFRRMQAPSGFFYGISDGERLFGDDFADIGRREISLVRKSADALYFSACILLEMKKKGEAPILCGFRDCADAPTPSARCFGGRAR